MEKMISPPRFNPWLLASSGLMALTAGVHAFAGGPEFYAPLRAGTLDPVVTAGFSVIWHVITVLLVALAIGLVVLTRARNPALFWMIAGLQLGFSILFIGYGLADLGTLWLMPQWVIFLLILSLMTVGQYT